MNTNVKKLETNPMKSANPLSVMTFTWLFKIFRKGFGRDLEISDLYAPLHEHSSGYLGDRISEVWNEEEKRCKNSKGHVNPSLLRVLVRCFGGKIVVFGLVTAFVELAIRTSRPVVLIQLMRYFNDKDRISMDEAYIWATVLVVGVFIDCLFFHSSVQGLMHMGMKMRVACCSLIYRKLLKISRASTGGESSVGQMINLISNDVGRLDESVLFLHYVWIAPIQTALVAYLLYREMHLAAVGGVCMVVFFTLPLAIFGKLQTYLTSKFAKRTDERLKLTNEVIGGIKAIKMYAWEKPFSLLIGESRTKEIKPIKNKSIFAEISLAMGFYIPRACLFVSILAYVLFGNRINAEKVFLAMAYYNVIRLGMFRNFPLGVTRLADLLVSLKRIRACMLFDELRDDLSANKNAKGLCPACTNVTISFKDVSSCWSMNSSNDTLKDLNLTAKSGTLVAVVGQVGAGKTSLFHTIMNELPLVRGELIVRGSISYASQEPWIFASSVRQNILFGKEMNQERYDKVVDVCQLRRDFNMFPNGDQTVIGERGISMSGGQCARLNLARAVYFDADIYLLDDPLSAVDARVGRLIFQDCIKSFLKEKTVILVTHQFQFLKDADHIVVLNEGEIQAQGTFDELQRAGLDAVKVSQVTGESHGGSGSGNDAEFSEPSDATTSDEICKHEPVENLDSRMYETNSIAVYFTYFKLARNTCLVLTVAIVSVLSQVAASGGDYFVTYWVNNEEIAQNMQNKSGTADQKTQPRDYDWYIMVYGITTAATVALMLSQSWTFFQMCMKISKNLHIDMLFSTLHATMGFFNSNPLGRIMNRFSKDMGIVDTLLPRTILDVIQTAMQVTATVVLVAIVNPWLLIPTPIIGIFFYLFGLFFIRTSRSIKRLEGMTRSPVFNHLSASLQGLATIRALNAQQILTKEFDNHQNLHSSSWFILISGSRALGMYLDFLCTIFLGVLTYAMLLLHNSVLAGDVGLVITQVIVLSSVMQYGVRQFAEMENNMTSVERILEYTNLPVEANLNLDVDRKRKSIRNWTQGTNPDFANRTKNDKIAFQTVTADDPPKGWPREGRVEFRNLYLTYERQPKPALKNLNFVAAPREKIGIVGRTGAGKSSIIAALFRLGDLDGEIFIDGIPCSTLKLDRLRSKISIIPQEPVLFAGSLRRNLDPFEEFSDAQLWDALEQVGLKRFVDSDAGLYSEVTEGGGNFSVGQRQLLCLARAIIRNNKILVLDEATANVDPLTDELIQKTIRDKFRNCTVLTIAHRLNTVMDSDRIIAMDAGSISEFDHPYLLLKQQSGLLYSMTQQTGAAMAHNLLEIAHTSYAEKTNRDSEQRRSSAVHQPIFH